MVVFDRCFFVDDQNRLIEVTKFTRNFYACEFDLSLNPKIGPRPLGSEITLVFYPQDHATSQYELKIVAKIVGIKGTRIFCLFTDNLGLNLKRKVPSSELVQLPKGDYPVLAFAEHPWFISRPLGFSVWAFDRLNLHLSFEASQLMLLVAPLELKLKVQIPHFETFTLSGKIVELVEINGQSISVFRIAQLNPSFLEAMALYFLRNGDQQSRQQLKAAQISLPRFKGRLSLRGIATPEDFQRVLILRRQAHLLKKGSQVSHKSSPEDFRDRFDDCASIIGIHLGSTVVGTSRCVFNYGDLKQSEICQLGLKVPEFILKKGFVEVSRVATDPDLRGKDLFQMLIYYAFRIAHLTGHQFILADCEDHLLPVYKKFEAKDLGQKVRHPVEGIDLNVVYFDVKRILKKAKYLKLVLPLGKRTREMLKEIEGISRSPVEKT